MRPKAVFLDFDDTLVLTKKADEAAFLKTQELAKRVIAEVSSGTCQSVWVPPGLLVI